MKFRIIVIALVVSLTESSAEDSMGSSGNDVSQRASTGGAGATNTAIPPNAEPGKCYARVMTGGHYRMTTRRIEIHPAYERLDVIPEKYKTVPEEVVVIPEHREGDVLVEKLVEFIVQPASDRLVATQATHKTISERLKVRDAYTTWKRGKNPAAIIDSVGGRITGAEILKTKQLKTGETLALVKVLAQFAMVERIVLDTPASVRRVRTPSKTRTISVKEIVEKSDSGSLIPAETIMISKRVSVAPAAVQRVTVPATYKNVSYRERSGAEPLQWREILCETHMSPDIIRHVQDALQTSGFYQGPVDGTYSPSTASAIARYQRSKGVSIRGLTPATLKSLGIELD